MKLIVGLGNPGIEYQFTPHNAGFLAIDRIAETCGVSVVNRRGKALTAKARIANQDVLLAKPETFMNLSGLSIAALLKELELGPFTKGEPAEDLIVLYDELAIPLGQLRIRERGSAAGHNGIKSILSVLGTDEFLRIRIGVGKPPTVTGREVKAGGTDYLLSPMRRMALQELDTVLDDAQRALEVILTDGVKKAMNEFNRKVTGTPDDPAPQ
jgi:PTH1 family peptidyl-tRNA hydrolase